MPTVRLADIPINLRTGAVARIIIQEPDLTIPERYALLARAIWPEPDAVANVTDDTLPDRLWHKAAPETWHGTESGYRRHKCRCGPCKQAASDARYRRRMQARETNA